VLISGDRGRDWASSPIPSSESTATLRATILYRGTAATASISTRKSSETSLSITRRVFGG
jgi:hypothetical protein